MKEFIVLMHNDSVLPEAGDAWQRYIISLKARGVFGGGSSIGDGACYRKDGSRRGLSQNIAGYITVRADNLAGAAGLLEGNPAFECGGTVEVRELIED